MRLTLRRSVQGLRRDNAGGLLLLFVMVGVLLPTISVLWFMNEAAQSQATVDRQRVNEAYRGQLTLVRDQLDADWNTRIAALEQQAGARTAADFRRVVATGLAESVVFFNADGSVAYPSSAIERFPEEVLSSPDWTAAQKLEQQAEWYAAAASYDAVVRTETDVVLATRAAQASVRCLVQSGDRDAAVRAIQRYFGAGHLAELHNPQRRFVAADELLLALQLLKPTDPRSAPIAQRLVRLLDDYDAVAMPSAQRVFLMDQLHTLLPDTPALPTDRAERMALQFLDATGPRLDSAGLHSTAVSDLWALGSTDGRIVALYHTSSVIAALDRLLEAHKASAGVTFVLAPPGTAVAGDFIAAGPRLVGWQMSYSLANEPGVDEIARPRRVAYLWVGVLVITVMIVMGFVVGQSFRQQLQLARLKTDLVAAVSHELRTPVASMRLLVDSLLEDPHFDRAKTRDYLQLMSGENLRLSRLIDNFLTFSRIERNRQRLEFDTAMPSHLVASAVRSMQQRVQAADCHLEVHVNPELPAVRADRDALVTVLVNLLDNAFKYTPAAKRIVVRADRDGRSIAFSVEDNGIGIAAREQKRIFRRFYQVDRRLARDTGGCGLGLSIVDFIVRAHGGTVRVASQPGAGSVFTVTLPCRDDVPEAAA